MSGFGFLVKLFPPKGHNLNLKLSLCVGDHGSRVIDEGSRFNESWREQRKAEKLGGFQNPDLKAATLRAVIVVSF